MKLPFAFAPSQSISLGVPQRPLREGIVRPLLLRSVHGQSPHQHLPPERHAHYAAALVQQAQCKLIFGLQNQTWYRLTMSCLIASSIGLASMKAESRPPAPTATRNSFVVSSPRPDHKVAALSCSSKEQEDSSSSILGQGYRMGLMFCTMKDYCCHIAWWLVACSIPSDMDCSCRSRMQLSFYQKGVSR